jgi:hypothetical protein
MRGQLIWLVALSDDSSASGRGLDSLNGAIALQGPVQVAACLDDGFIRGIGELCAEPLRDSITHPEAFRESLRGQNRERQGLEHVGATHIDLALAIDGRLL